MSDAASPAGNPEEPKSFTEWLKQIPVTYGLISVAAGAVLGLVAPEILLPEPLNPYRPMATLMVVVAFVLTWAWQERLRLHLRTLATAAAVIFVVLACLRVLFVREVHFTSPPPETRYYIVGTHVQDPDLAQTSDVEIIKLNGGTWSDLKRAWGASFVVVTTLYALAYLAFVQLLILTIGGSDVARSAHAVERQDAHTK